MQARPRSVFDIFDSKKRYMVPLFQRQYVWSREAQWEPLWEDIKTKTTSRLLNHNSLPHFLGAIVLDQIRTYGNAVPAHIIIDGQQRLTTFQIFLVTFRDVCKIYQEIRYAEELDRYILNSGIMDNPDEECYKVWPTKMDQKYFIDVIMAKSRENIIEHYPKKYEGKTARPRPQMIEAYLYFYSSINEFINGKDRERKIEALYQSLRNDLEVVSIELEGNDDPQVIFETLNARGEPLLPSDLLRNFLFWRATQNKEEQDVLYQTYWEQYDHHFWKKEEKQGRLKRPRIDLFMQHFLQAKTMREVNIGRMFQEYRHWIKEESPYDSVKSELVDLDKYAQVFKGFITPDTASRFGIFTWRLKQFDISTLYPLILYLVCEANLKEAEFEGIIIDLESYILRRAMCNKTTKNYNKIFMQLLRDLHKNGTSRDNLQKYLMDLSGDAVIWPNDDEFNQAWLSKPIYTNMNRKKLETILRAIESELHTAKAEKITIHSPLTIEHIMPQEWTNKWPLSDGTIYKYSKENSIPTQVLEREGIKHTIGNLTLLTNSLNSSVSNSLYDIKKPEIIKQSALSLNSYFQNVEKWNEVAIIQRGNKLFKLAKLIWPYPSST